ncbi:DUF4350 domain-containing protein [Sutcliffiella cohnii]
MQLLNSQKKTWFILSLFLVLLLIAAYISFTPEEKQHVPFMSDSPSPTGVKAFYTYLGGEYKSVQRWNYSPDLLPDSSNNVLFLIGVGSLGNSDELMYYEQFLQNGNTIILLKDNPANLFSLQVKSSDTSSNIVNTLSDYKERTYSAEITSPYRLVLNEERDELLLQDEYGVVALKRQYGNGSLIVVNSSSWVTNRTILQQDHIPILVTLLKELEEPNAIYFNDYVHYPNTSYWEVYPTWFILLLLHSIIIVFLWLLHKGKRFGTIITPREEMVRFSDESIRALSAWYIRGNKYVESLQYQASYVRAIMQEKWGIATYKEWEDVQQRIEEKCSKISNKELASLLNQLPKVLQSKSLTKKEYLTWSKKIDQLRKEVEE